MKKYFVIIALLLFCIKVKAQKSPTMHVDTFLDMTSNRNTVTVFLKETTAITKILSRNNITISQSVLSKFDGTVISNYVLYGKQTADPVWQLSFTYGSAILHYELYTKDSTVLYRSIYRWSVIPLVILIVYLVIMFYSIQLLFWITPEDERWTLKGEFFNTILGVTAGSIFAFLVIEDKTVLAWDQILLCFLASTFIFFIARWAYRRREEKQYASYRGGGTLIE